MYSTHFDNFTYLMWTIYEGTRFDNYSFEGGLAGRELSYHYVKQQTKEQSIFDELKVSV